MGKNDAMVVIRVPKAWRETFGKFGIELTSAVRESIHSKFLDLVIQRYDEIDKTTRELILLEANEKIAEAEKYLKFKEKLQQKEDIKE